MFHLRPLSDSAPPAKRARIEASVETSRQKIIDNFLINLMQGLILGIDSFNQASDIKTYAAMSAAVAEALCHYQNNAQDGAITIPILISPSSSTLTLQESESGVEMKIEGVKKVIGSQTFLELMSTLNEDIRNHSDQYERELTTYLANTVKYGNDFAIYSKALSPSSFNKNQLYISMGHDRLIQDFNCKVPSFSPNKNFVCWQFSAQVGVESLTHEFGKVDFTNHLSTPSAIAGYISTYIGKYYGLLKVNADVMSLIRNENLGKYIKACFENMSKPEEQQNIKLLIIESTTHSMAIMLRIKESKGSKREPIYVVRFYEPGISNAVVRYETYDLSDIESRTLKQYIDGTGKSGQNNYEWFYDGIEPISMVFECSPANLIAPIVQRDRKLTHLDSDLITPTHLNIMLGENCYVDLLGLKGRLQEIGTQSPSQLIELIAAEDEDGVSGFYYALRSGHAKVIKAYGELLQLITDEEVLVDLLEAKKTGKPSGIYHALKANKISTIYAYVELIKLLPKYKHLTFINALNLGNREDLRLKLCRALRDSYT